MDTDGLLSSARILLPMHIDLGLGLFRDVADGGTLLADDGTHLLGGHQEPQGDAHLLLLGWVPGCHRGALVGLTPEPRFPWQPSSEPWAICSSGM